MCRLEGQIILAVDLREIPEAAAGIRGRFSRGRRAAEVIARIGRIRGTGTLSRVLAVYEEGAVSDYFHSSSLVSVFVLVVAGLDGAVDSDQATLGLSVHILQAASDRSASAFPTSTAPHRTERDISRQV